MKSNCCNAPVLWTSYNHEDFKDQPKDHFTCFKCKEKLDMAWEAVNAPNVLLEHLVTIEVKPSIHAVVREVE